MEQKMESGGYSRLSKIEDSGYSVSEIIFFLLRLCLKLQKILREMLFIKAFCVNSKKLCLELWISFQRDLMAFKKVYSIEYLEFLLLYRLNATFSKVKVCTGRYWNESQGILIN